MEWWSNGVVRPFPVLGPKAAKMGKLSHGDGGFNKLLVYSLGVLRVSPAEIKKTSFSTANGERRSLRPKS
jgi:hypothetical protein